MAVVGHQVILFSAVGQKSELDKDSWHRGAARDIERLLLHPSVFAAHVVAKCVLNGLGQFYALLNEGVLKHGQHDVRLGLGGVKALVDFLVVFLQNDGIFAHGDPVFVVVVFTHNVGRRTVGRAVFGGVAVNRDKDVALGAIRDNCAFVEGGVGVVAARHHHLDVGKALLDVLFDLEGNG